MGNKFGFYFPKLISNEETIYSKVVFRGFKYSHILTLIEKFLLVNGYGVPWTPLSAKHRVTGNWLACVSIGIESLTVCLGTFFSL
jgi:hypothetical protein